MRLYTLDIQGIGPFADPVHIDFRDFSDAGLFLLRGQTGSGKSTILDAIVFALYGDVAKGSTAAKERLRSTFADPRTPSRVTLVFGAASGVYRVTRTPAYRKEGNSSDTRATMLLEEVVICEDGSFDTVSAVATAIQEATTTVRSLVGLDKDQFLQTIILPQGQFAKFLSASSNERQPILQSIFGTKRFTDFQQLLASHAKEARHELSSLVAAVDHARQRCQGSLSSATQAVNEAAAVLQGDSSSSVGTFLPCEEGDTPCGEDENYTRVLDALHDDCERLGARLRDLEAQQKSAAALHAQAQRAQDRAVEYQRLTADFAILKAQAEDMAARQVELDHARQAESLRAPLHSLESAWTELKSTHGDMRRVLQNLTPPVAGDDPTVDISPDVTSTVASHMTADVTVATRSLEGHTPPQVASDLSGYVEDAERRANAELARLAPVLALEKELPERREALLACSDMVSTTARDLNDLQAERDELPEKRQALTRSVDDARTLAATCEARRATWRDLTDRVNAAKLLPNLRSAEQSAHQELTGAVRSAAQAQARASELRSAWLADAASALAGELRDGQPCLVCGSPTHPHPASPHEGQVITLDLVNDAQADSDAQHEAVNAARRALDDAQAQVSACEERAQGSIEELTEQCAQAKAALDEARAAEDQLPDLTRQEDALRSREQEISHEISDKQREYATLSARLNADQQRLNADEAQVLDARGAWDSVEQRVSAYSAWSDSLTHTRTTLNAHLHASTRWTGAQEELERWYNEAHSPEADEHSTPLWIHQPWQSFDMPLPTGDLLTDVLPSLVDAQMVQALATNYAALRTPAEISELATRVDEYSLSVRTTRARLEHEDFTTLTGLEDQHLTAASERLSAISEHLKAAHGAMSRAKTRWDVACEDATAYTAACDSLSAQSHNLAPIQRLSGLANSTSPENTSHIPLSAWVLIRQFDEVVHAANPRLTEMSAGRYELSRTDASGRQSQKHGLDLVIIDHETDTRRHPDTLSGGESFYVALSLALGLADVVSGENGGTIMESMFIDEGFGTLDEHTLDAVMTELQRLRDSGRLIGVVSHVPELARRIREHIVVTKSGKTGSHVHVIA